MRLECIGGECGLCCAVMGGNVVVAPEEVGRLPRASIEHRKAGPVITGTDGVCTLLKGKACSCYQSRPRGCREYPWYNFRGRLFYDIGCPGILFDRDGRPDVRSITPVQKYFPLSKPVQKFILALVRFW